MTKQTAANNHFLRNVKRVFNGKIYAKTLKIMNDQDEQAARAYIQTWVRPGTNLDTFLEALSK